MVANSTGFKLNIRTGYEYGSGYDKTTISVTGKIAAINVYGTNANILKDVVLPTELRPAVSTFIVGTMLYNNNKYLAFLGISADGTIGISYLPTYPADNIWPGGVPCYFTGAYVLP